METVKKSLYELTTNMEHQSTLWHATPFGMVFLSRILEKALAESGRNPAAHFLAGELLDFFSCILQCFHDGDEMEHAEPLPLFSDLLKEEYLWSEEYDEEEDEMRYEEDEVFPDDLFYSFYYYSWQEVKAYYIVDTLQTAIQESKQISFQYYEHLPTKEKVLKHEGYRYQFSPYSLIWNRDFYYMVGWSEKHNTLMHETCHQIFRMLFPTEYMPPTQYRKVCCCTSAMYGPRLKPTNWEEWRVNTLTAAILMPKELLIEQMHAAGLGEKLRLLNKVFAPKEYKAFSTVAETMGVSKSALAIRMKQLHLLDRDDLKDPYALVRVECDQE